MCPDEEGKTGTLHPSPRLFLSDFFFRSKKNIVDINMLLTLPRKNISYITIFGALVNRLSAIATSCVPQLIPICSIDICDGRRPRHFRTEEPFLFFWV